MTIGAKLIGHPEQRLPGYGLLYFPGQDHAALIDEFADYDNDVSGGSACHADVPTLSRVLAEMGVDSNLALAAVRFSMERDTISDDVEPTPGTMRTPLQDTSG